MKIQSISSSNYGANYNKNNKNNVSFGRILDENARQEIRRVLIPNYAKDEPALRKVCEDKVKLIENCPFCDVYTDRNGKINAAYDYDYLKNFTINGKRAKDDPQGKTLDVDTKEYFLDGATNDTFIIWTVFRAMSNATRIIAGEPLDVVMPPLKKSDGDASAEEARRLQEWRLNNLAQ